MLMNGYHQRLSYGHIFPDSSGMAATGFGCNYSGYFTLGGALDGIPFLDFKSPPVAMPLDL